MFQDDNGWSRRPSFFESISWNDRKSRYSQAKLEPCGLFRALKAVKVWIMGVKKPTIAADAKFTTFNPLPPWIAGILTCDFTLKHVSATCHKDTSLPRLPIFYLSSPGSMRF